MNIKRLCHILIFCVICACTTAPPAPPWNKAPLITLAKQLYSKSFGVASAAVAEFDGGAPGQDDLANLNGASQTYLLLLEEDSATLANTLPELKQIESYAAQAASEIPDCSPPYGQVVTVGFKQVQDLISQIEVFYK